MVFVKLRFDLGKVTLSQRQYLQFFCDFFNKMGTSSINYDEMSELFNLHTTGLDVTYDSYYDSEKDNELRSYLLFSISCLNKNLDKMLELIISLSSDLRVNDVRHFATLLRNQTAYLQNHVFDDTLSYASNSANSHLSEASFITDVNFSTRFILNVGKHYEEADGYTRGLYLDDFGYQMTSLLNSMFNKHRMVVLAHAEEKMLKEVQEKLSGFVDNVRHRFQGFELQLPDSYETPADKFKPSFMKKATLL